MGKIIKSSGLLSFFSIFLLVFTFLLCNMIYINTCRMAKDPEDEKYSIRLKSGSDIENGFDIKEARELREVLTPERITFYAFDKAVVKSGYYQEEAQICGIEGTFAELNRISLLNGAFLNGSDSEKKNNVAVIDSSLAKELFNSTDIIGLKITLYGSNFTIIGVSKRESSVFGILTDREPPYIYIPLSLMNEKNSGCRITNFEFGTSDGSLGKTGVADKLSAFGRNSDDFYITAYRDLEKLAEQRDDIILFIIWIYSIVLLLCDAVHIIKNFIEAAKTQTKDYYLWDALKKNIRQHMYDLIKFIVILAAVILIWKVISFDFYISPERIPDDPTSLSEIFDIFKTSLKNFLAEDQLYTLHSHRIMALMQKTGGVAFVLCMFSLFMVLFNIPRKGLHSSGKIAAIRLGSFFVVSIILSVFIIFLFGMSFELQLKDVLLLSGGLLIILQFRDKRLNEAQFNKKFL